jgi:hypothetical protein
MVGFGVVTNDKVRFYMDDQDTNWQVEESADFILPNK